MSEWIRRPELDDAFNDMHKIKPQVSFLRENRNKYNIKLSLSGKEVVISETMDRGLTSFVSLRYEGETKSFGSMFEAEQYASQILRG